MAEVKNHYSYQPKGEDLALEADYVVVGSGAGGSAVASGLARGGAKVLVVEAGAWRDPKDYPYTAYGTMRDLMDDWGSQVTRGRALWPVVQASCVGGGTVINSAICVRTPEDVIELWQNERGFGKGEYARSIWEALDLIEKELSVEEAPANSRGYSNRLAMVGANNLGMDSHYIRRYAKACEGSGQCLQGCRKERKQSTNLNWIPEVLEKGGTMVSCAPVKRVRFEGKKAVAVEGRFRHPQFKKAGAAFHLRAKKAVIIAASATHSPALLQRSGIKSSALGQGFMAHPGAGVFGLYDDPVDQNLGVTQGWASTQYRTEMNLKLETLAIPMELVASRLGGGGQELVRRFSKYRHMAMWVQATRAETRGTIKNGWGDRPVVRYTLSRRDMERFRAGLHLVAKLHVAAGAKSLVPGIYGVDYELPANDVDKILEASLDPRAYVGVLSHLFGGCSMGTDPAQSVCDPQGRVHGYENLVVADASAIPTTLGVNPQHTIMALGRMRAAELLQN